MKLKSLNCSFLSDADILKLNLVNIHTSEQLITYSDLEALSRIASIPLKHLKLVKKFIIGQYSPFPEFGNVLFDKYLRKNFIIKTGCIKIDEIISSGVYSSEITEISGASSTGKTQICFNLIANMLDKYEQFSCLYIDSSKNFCSRRLIQLIKCRLLKKLKNNSDVNMKINELSKQIKVFDCQNVFHLLDILYQIKKNESSSLLGSSLTKEKLVDESLSPNLLIIDNLTSLFNQFKINNNLEINFYLNYISSYLKYLTVNMNMAVVVITNHNDYTVSYTYGSSSYSNALNFNCLYNSTWKSVPNLIVNLKNSQNFSQSQFQNSSSSENELKSQDKSYGNNLRIFEVVKINRPFLKEPFKKTCYFQIDENGLL